MVAEGSIDRIEVGLIGREGMSGLSIVLGDSRSPHSTCMQVAGEGQFVSVGCEETVSRCTEPDIE